MAAACEWTSGPAVLTTLTADLLLLRTAHGGTWSGFYSQETVTAITDTSEWTAVIRSVTRELREFHRGNLNRSLLHCHRRVDQ